MNVFAISLVLTALVTAGVFSPNPEKKDDVIVKEGHRVVVVEYEPNDHGQTKVSISPPETEHKAKAEHVSVSDKISAKAEGVEEKIGGFHGLNARELVCDAYGKCKHKIASALEGTKESVSEKMHEIQEDAKEGFEKVTGKAHEATEKAKETVGKKVDEVKQGAKETAEKVKIKAVDTTNTLKRHLLKNASEDLDLIEEKVKEDAESLKVEGIRDYNVGRRFFSDVSAYIFSAESFRSLMGIFHLMGFALSYGVSFWMTFVSSNVMARALPKQQFAMAQSKIYPAYFKTVCYGIASAFLGHMWSQNPPYYANIGETIQGLIFVLILSATLFNCFYLEPRASKAMRERIKLEKEEGKGRDVFDVEPSTSSVDAFKDPTGVDIGKTTTHEPLENQRELSQQTAKLKPEVERLSLRLKKLNVISSVLNIFTLMGLSYHLVYLSQLLHSNR